MWGGCEGGCKGECKRERMKAKRVILKEGALDRGYRRRGSDYECFIYQRWSLFFSFECMLYMF